MLLVLDGILGANNDESIIRNNSAFAHLGSVSELFRLSIPESETPEALLLGLDPDEGQLRQGPLTVSSLGWDPPDRSLHFHLSLLCLESLRSPRDLPNSLESEQIRTALARLNTKKLTQLWGSELDHGLVWERLSELRTVAPDALKDSIQDRPQGEGDQELTRYIDDSVNVLMELEINHRRIDQGLDAINLAWPWGHGLRLPVPNLALRYGYPFQVVTNSLRLRGLARLAGFRNDFGVQLGSGLRTKFENLVFRPGCIASLDPWRTLRSSGHLDEAEYLVREFAKRGLKPLLDHARDHQSFLSAILLSDAGALGIRFSGKPSEGVWPLDERSLDEPKIPTLALHEFARSYFSH